jgi:hypothetical protein
VRPQDLPPGHRPVPPRLRQPSQRCEPAALGGPGTRFMVPGSRPPRSFTGGRCFFCSPGCDRTWGLHPGRR